MEEDKLQQHLEMGLLLARYVNDELNAEEQQLVNEWLANEDNHKLFNQIIEKDYAISQLARLNQLNEKKSVCRERVAEKIAGLFFVGQKQSWWKRYSYIAAASVVVLLSASVYLLYNHRQNQMPPQQSQPLAHDAEPGKFKARLTLDDGSTITLDSAAAGQLATQGNTIIVKKDGQLVYQGSSVNTGNKALYNTLTTAKGEMYATVLADGSKVWLNSQSSIRYPVALTGGERKVEITGEAYFEVTPSLVAGSKRPFVVNVNGMTVEVLGTHFNINAYGDESAVKTTLLEGKVKVAKGSSLKVLAPGQQAQVSENAAVKVINDADVEQAVAWKNGYFQFKNDDLKAVLRQLARWYDLDIVYEGQVSDDIYSGKISRTAKISEVFSVLETNQVQFKVVGKKLVVSP